MTLHEILSVRAVSNAVYSGVYIASVDITDINGERYICDYTSIPGDQFGMAPDIREEIDKWIASGKPVLPED